MDTINLNEYNKTDLIDNSEYISNCLFDSVEVHFRDITEKLIEKINKYKNDYIFGSIAWLTSTTILKALSKCKNVQIVIQKEDFLKPDYTVNNTYNKIEWICNIRELYNNLHCELDRHNIMGRGELSYCSQADNEPSVKVVGIHKKYKTYPRAHNKFLIFARDLRVNIKFKCGHTMFLHLNKHEKMIASHTVCPDCYFKMIEEKKYNNLCDHFNLIQINQNAYNEICNKSDFPDFYNYYAPVEVWTGSFNFSHNASLSFENILSLKDMSGWNPILKAYLKEYRQLFSISEQLNWTHEYICPDYHYGS